MQHRIGVTALFLALGFGIVSLRLADLQVFRQSSLLAKAERQQIRSVDVLGRRGSILDCNHQPLAQSVETESVFLSGRMVSRDNVSELVAALSQGLGVSSRDIRHKIAVRKSFYVKRGVKVEVASRLKDMKFASLSFEPESQREYPQGSLACQLLGFTDIDGRGIEGLEKEYDKVLAGRPGKKELVVDARGLVIPSATSWSTTPKDGVNLVLTINNEDQHIAERELGKAFEKYHAKYASMVVMDPNTGEILALANYPQYDPNDPAEASEFSRRDHAVCDAFEPGSTFKAVTAALALQYGVVDLDTPVDCHQGREEFFGRIVRDHGSDHMGVVPFSDVIAQSSNVGTTEVAIKLGAPKLYEGALRFGFGEPTGIDLPGEATGLLRPLKDWTPGSMAAIPFGQEVSCNLLHVARLYAAIANGGRLVTPHVVKSFEDQNGGDMEAPQKPSGQRVISESVRKKLLALLEDVVEQGTGTPTALPGYRVAGKTGTSEIFDVKRHAYMMNENISSFVGFVPAENPKFLCAVMLDDPQGLTLGGWVAGPVFRTTMGAMLASSGIPQDPTLLAQASHQTVTHATRWTINLTKGQPAVDVKWVKVPGLVGTSLKNAKDLLRQAGLKMKVSGSGSLVVAQFPNAGESLRQFSFVKLLLESSKPVAMAGKQKRGLD